MPQKSKQFFGLNLGISKVTEIKTNVALIRPFSECNSSLNSQMAMKWSTKFESAYKRCPIVFQGHLLDLSVTRADKLMIVTPIEGFRVITSVESHRWLHNNAPGLKWRRGGGGGGGGGGGAIIFSMSSVKFRSHMGKKVKIWLRLEHFQITTPIWIHQWLCNDTQARKRFPNAFRGYLSNQTDRKWI